MNETEKENIEKLHIKGFREMVDEIEKECKKSNEKFDDFYNPAMKVLMKRIVCLELILNLTIDRIDKILQHDQRKQ